MIYMHIKNKFVCRILNQTGTKFFLKTNTKSETLINWVNALQLRVSVVLVRNQSK